jgi:hypothetical protein
MFTGRGKQLTIFTTETDHYRHQALLRTHTRAFCASTENASNLRRGGAR